MRYYRYLFLNIIYKLYMIYANNESQSVLTKYFGEYCNNLRIYKQ